MHLIYFINMEIMIIYCTSTELVVVPEPARTRSEPYRTLTEPYSARTELERTFYRTF